MTRSVILASLVSMTGLAAAASSWAWDPLYSPPPSDAAPASGVSFVGPQDPVLSPSSPLAFGDRSAAPLRWGDYGDLDPPARFSETSPLRYEVSLALPSRVSGLGLDVGLAQRTTLSVGRDGQLARAGSSTELRLGQGLERLVRPWESPTWDEPTWYFFAASDGQALTWRPETTVGATTDGLRWQDRAEVGDFQAGVSLEAGGLQASLAYVQRDISARDVQGRDTSASDNFTGVTLTWRR